MNALELRSARISLDDETPPDTGAAEASSPMSLETVDEFLVRADTSLFTWVFR